MLTCLGQVLKALFTLLPSPCERENTGVRRLPCTLLIWILSYHCIWSIVLQVPSKSKSAQPGQQQPLPVLFFFLTPSPANRKRKKKKCSIAGKIVQRTRAHGVGSDVISVLICLSSEYCHLCVTSAQFKYQAL